MWITPPAPGSVMRGVIRRRGPDPAAAVGSLGTHEAGQFSALQATHPTAKPHVSADLTPTRSFGDESPPNRTFPTPVPVTDTCARHRQVALDSNDVGHIRRLAEARSQDQSVDSNMRKVFSGNSNPSATSRSGESCLPRFPALNLTTKAFRYLDRQRPTVAIFQWWTGTVLHTYLRLAILRGPVGCPDSTGVARGARYRGSGDARRTFM